jgi:transcription elongation factor/antiterminator RfaH
MKQWYALHSKPKQETLAVTLLTGAGIEVFFPQTPVHKQHGKPPVLEPFFPGYLFGHLDPDRAEIRLASYTRGILYVVGYGSEPYPVPDELILYIQQRLARRRGQVDREQFHHGERVIISNGPLRGAEAIFDRHLSGTGRVRVLINILTRQCPAEVHVRHLRRPDQAAKIVSP